VNVNVTIEIRSLVSEALKHLKLAMASHRTAFSGNTSLIATLSSTDSKYPVNFVYLDSQNAFDNVPVHIEY